MTLPNFLIIGAAKSGTTALYRYIKQHPDVYMPERKEPHHFSFDENSKLTNGPSDYIRSAITNFTHYQNLFKDVKNEAAIGEASPTYLYIPGTAERIFSVIPDVKLIAILRHPAERAFSAYMHVVRDGFEEIHNFEEALRKENERIAKNWGPIWHYTKCGFYFEQLGRYYPVFGPERMHIILYDDFKKDPNEVLKNIYTFLEVDDAFVPDMRSKPNVSGIPKNRTWQRIISYFFGQDNFVRNISRILFPAEFRWRFTSTVREINLTQPQLPYQTRVKLIDLFRNDILNLQDLIKRDLGMWLEK